VKRVVKKVKPRKGIVKKDGTRSWLTKKLPENSPEPFHLLQIDFYYSVFKVPVYLCYINEKSYKVFHAGNCEELKPENIEKLKKGLENYGFLATDISSSYTGLYSNTKGKTNPFYLIVFRKVADCERSYNGNPENFKLHGTITKFVTSKKGRKRRKVEPEHRVKICENFVRNSDFTGLEEVVAGYLEETEVC